MHSEPPRTLLVDVNCVAGGSTAAVGCGTPGARYQYKGAGVGGAFQAPVKPFVVPGNSLWQIKIGARYKF